MTRARGCRATSRRNNPGNGRIANPVPRSLPLKLPYQKPLDSLIHYYRQGDAAAAAASSRQLAPLLSMTFRREIRRVTTRHRNIIST